MKPAEAAPRASAPIPRAPGSPKSWGEALGASGLFKLLVLAALLGWFYKDHFVRLYRFWQEPDWSHGFLIPLFGLYVIHLKRDRILSQPQRGSIWGLALMVGSSYVYFKAIQMQVGYPQPLSIVTMVAGMVLLMCGWRTLWLTLFPIFFFVLAIPPPDRLYRSITQPLQQGAAAVSTFVLNALPGAEVERDGINITYWMMGGSSGHFTVAGACSGMRSLMAFVALGLAMAYFTPRPLWHRLLMAGAVIPVALTCNVIRVIATGCFQMYGHADLASGSPHMILGLFTFMLGFAIYYGILWVLDHMFVEGEEEDAAPAAGRAG